MNLRWRSVRNRSNVKFRILNRFTPSRNVKMPIPHFASLFEAILIRNRQVAGWKSCRRILTALSTDLPSTVSSSWRNPAGRTPSFEWRSESSSRESEDHNEKEFQPGDEIPSGEIGRDRRVEREKEPRAADGAEPQSGRLPIAAAPAEWSEAGHAGAEAGEARESAP